MTSRISHRIASSGPHWRGHLLLFGSAQPEGYDPASGTRLLLIVVLIEGVLGPRMGLLKRIALDVPPAWVRVPVLLGLVLALVRWVAHVKPSQLGFRSWAAWNQTERSYFVQVFILANVIMGLIFAKDISRLSATPGLWGHGLVVLLTSFLWGLYQELIYRGILQTELSRRWGTARGILAANVLYTFGPLHFYHFAEGSAVSSMAIFASTFAIGLFFGLLFARSGNLWMVSIFHGIGDWYIVGVTGLLS